MLNISEPSKSKFALFELGFRPFFLGAALVAIFSVIGWIMFYSMPNSFLKHAYYSALQWHSHEIIFGYTNAVIAGFLLTAVGNWTGRTTISNWPLAGLVVLWLAARVLPFISNSGWGIAIIDLLFYPYLAIAIAVPIIKSGNKRNLFLIGIISLLAIANALVHASLLGYTNLSASFGSYIALYVQLLLIVIFAGRVFAFFTGRGVKVPFEPKKYKWLEISSIASFALLAILDIFPVNSSLFVGVAIITAILHTIRLQGWYSHQIWAVPLVWVLHLGYFFLIIGVVLKALSIYYPTLSFPALHALTVGALGLITIGMMARVSLGHTGRNIKQPPKQVPFIFMLIIIASIVRVFIPIIMPEHTLISLQISAIAWSAAFLVFFITYLPFLVKPRIDGLPG